ncbi:efflux RND transporter permease subunit [Parvularcula maris]|uniref:Efflux RND transporter permease subunit n=1 Tax=Parvularcula maris TaxID=2965077 RepID=A0A9X2L815_9PROT|nr:efflux RND transporter permease subunit [Parvularcula maris]
MISSLPAFAVKRPLFAGVLNLLIVIAGLAAIFGVEVREMPDVDRPIVSVRAVFPGAAPETMDAEVTSVLEGAVARVSGVEDIRSSSEENNARIRVSFRPGTDLDTAANDVREAIAQVSRNLPDRVEQLSVTKADDDADPILQLAVLAPTLSEDEVTFLIDNAIAPELQAIEGVASVGRFGARERQLRVVIDPLRLSRYGLTVGDVAAALRSAPFDVPVGSFASRDQSLIVRAEATAATPERIKQIILRDQITVGDVAEAYFAPADATNFTRLNGQPVVGLSIVRQAQSNTIEISTEVKKAVERINRRLDNAEVLVYTDDAVFITASVREVITSLFITVAVVMGTIFVFFGSARATLIPSLAIPVALIGTLAGIYILGFSVNVLTLLALVLATGLIVDDAIVVLENVQKKRGEGQGRRAAAVTGTSQVFFAVVATTAVLVSVFVPISFLPSEVGRLFREFGFVLAIAVVISSFIALTLVPALASRMGTGRDSLPPRVSRFGGAVQRGYDRALGVCLSRPLLSVGVGVFAAGAAAFLYPVLDKELTPPEDRGQVFVFARGPDGVGLDFMNRQAALMEEIVAPYAEEGGPVEGVFTVVGRYDPNIVYMTLPLKSWEDRKVGQEELIAELRGPLEEIPGVRGSPFGRGSLQLGWGGSRNGVQVALTGGDYLRIFESARDLSDRIEAESNILLNPEISYQPTQPQIAIKVDRQRAADLGVDLDELSVTLRSMVGGDEIVDLNVGDRAIPVLLSAETGSVTDPSDLQNLFIRTGSGQLVPLSSMTEIVEEGVAAELDRTEQRRAIELEADIADGVTLEEAVSEIERLADETLPDTIDMLLQGDAAGLQETSNELLLTYGFAFVIVFLVLVAQFESLTSAVVVLLSVPFALAAALFALFLTGTSLNIFSQIGLVMLIGLMAKNGILMVEFADQLRAEGRKLGEATLEAASRRLRPIVMTLISTVLGAVPLILSSGAGAEARQAIGWVVFGGLGLAGLFTLFLTPVIYLLVARFGAVRSAETEALEQELKAAEAL